MHFLMNQKAQEDYRYEIKFTCPGIRKVLIEQKIKTSPALFSSIFYPRWVNNIYFDSHDMDCYFNSISGLSPRVKVRVRWYGELFGTIQPVLEFKIKNAYKNIKASFDLEPFTLFSGITIHEAQKKVVENPKLNTEIQNLLKIMKPSLLNRYYRSYFQTDNKKHRITVDSNIGYTALLKTNIMRNIKNDSGNLSIIEIKFQQDEIEAAKIMTELAAELRLAKISKYVFGITN